MTRKVTIVCDSCKREIVGEFATTTVTLRTEGGTMWTFDCCHECLNEFSQESRRPLLRRMIDTVKRIAAKGEG